MALILKAKLNNSSSKECKIETSTYLVIYGSGWETPSLKNGSHDAGDSFKVVAMARHKLNQKEHPHCNCIVKYCPTDVEFFQAINNCTNIKQLDVYCHGFVHGLNLGGFIGERIINGKEINSDNIDWDLKKQDSGRDLRRVDIKENAYFESVEINELLQINPNVFWETVKVYFWGCNIGGQLTSEGVHVLDVISSIKNKKNISPKGCFAQKFAECINKGEVYALVGKGQYGGSVFKTDSKGKLYYEDGQMLPAYVAAQHKYVNTFSIDAYSYMKKFPL